MRFSWGSRWVAPVAITTNLTLLRKGFLRSPGRFCRQSGGQDSHRGSNDITDIKQSYPRLIALHEARTSYELFEYRVKKRIIESKKSEFSPGAVEAYETPEDQRTVEQQRIAAPVAEAVKKVKLSEQFTPEEQKEQQQLYARMAEAVLAVPENPAHGIHYDGLMELPTASVLGHRDPPLIPDVYVLNRGDLGNPKEKVQPALPAVLSDGTVLDDGSSPLLRFEDRKKLALWLTGPITR